MDKIKLGKLQLMRSITDTAFYSAYKKLVSNNQQTLTEDEKFLLLKNAVVFINLGEKELEKFGYRIILRYSNCFGDYKPLYDISLEKDYIPVAKFIEEKYFNRANFETSFHRLYLSAYKDDFKHQRNDETIYFSSGQKRIYSFSKNDSDFIIVAPTSYGKSEIIIHKVEDNLDKKICIIVPTKSLLAQTKKNLFKNRAIRESRTRIISHPDMLDSVPGNFIAVLTQERLLRLLQKHQDICFDIILIDEAHNLIEDDPREVLTIQDLKILRKRNPNTKLYFFTPFLANPENIKIFSKSDDLLIDRVTEHIKVEKYYTFDSLGEKVLKVYDQFLNKHFDVKKHSNFCSDFDFINTYAAKKNIVYINRPRFIEEFSASINNSIAPSDEIKKMQKALKDFLHEEYNLINALGNGVVYHHGGMPENVRLYVEHAFSKIESIKYIITSSTLLQGVNIPAEKIFLLDTKKGRGNLNAAQFKNLSGRVCRFSEVFDKNKGDLKLLEPEIYLIKGAYSSHANVEQFLSDRVKDNKLIPDEIENLLIKKNLTDLSELEKIEVHKTEEYQENIESGTTDLQDARIVQAEIAKACFKNNVHDFDIFDNEKQLEENYSNLADMSPVLNAEDLIELIESIFLRGIILKDSDGNDNFRRLQNAEARKFYSMFLDWRASGKSYHEMINNFIWYWDNKKTDSYIYVGSAWGEMPSPYQDGIRDLYIDLSRKSKHQWVNIAIIRIKEEQDFIDYKLMPYIEILNDIGLVGDGYYECIKYGTSDVNMIKLLKEGLSVELAKVIMDGKYSDYVVFSTDSVSINKDIIQKMIENDVNEILIFEMGYFTT